MEKLEELFKKFVYTGVGLVSLTKDKLQSTIEKMIKEDKISEKKLLMIFLKIPKQRKKNLKHS